MQVFPWSLQVDGIKYLAFIGPCIVTYSYNRSQKGALFLNFILVNNSTFFGQIYCPSSGVLLLYSQQLVFVILVAVNTVIKFLMKDNRSVRNM